MPKAMAMAVGGLDKMKEQFPKHMAAPIILYNQDGDLASAEEAFKKISGWGYKQVSVLSGGFLAWEKAGKQIAKGPAETKITYVRKLMPGEVDIAAFKEVVAEACGRIVDPRCPNAQRSRRRSSAQRAQHPYGRAGAASRRSPQGKDIGHSLFHRSPSSDGLQCTEKSRIRCKVCERQG